MPRFLRTRHLTPLLGAVGLLTTVGLWCHAATLNDFQAKLEHGVLNLKLMTDQAVTPQIQTHTVQSTGETQIFIPGASLSPLMLQNGNPAVMDTQGRFTAHADPAPNGVTITVSNLQNNALKLEVSQKQGSTPQSGLTAGHFSSIYSDKNNFLNSSQSTHSNATLGLHLVPRSAPKLSFNEGGESSRKSILGQAPVVSFDSLPAMQPDFGVWPFASEGGHSALNRSFKTGGNHLNDSSRATRDQTSDADKPATLMSSAGLLNPDQIPTWVTPASASTKPAETLRTIQELSIKRLLKELPIWLLPLLGFCLGGVGLLALTLTLVLIGGTLRYWPRSRTVALQNPMPADLPPPETDDLNAQHAQVKEAKDTPATLTLPKTGFAQVPILSVALKVRPIQPPAPTRTIAEAIHRTHLRQPQRRTRLGSPRPQLLDPIAMR